MSAAEVAGCGENLTIREDALALDDVGDVAPLAVTEEGGKSEDVVGKRMTLDGAAWLGLQSQEDVVFDGHPLGAERSSDADCLDVVVREPEDAPDALCRIADAEIGVTGNECGTTAQLLRPEALVSSDPVWPIGAGEPQAVGVAVAEAEQVERRAPDRRGSAAVAAPSPPGRKPATPRSAPRNRAGRSPGRARPDSR